MNGSLKLQLLKKNIIRHLHEKHGLSLSELSRQTGKSIPVITSAVNELIQEGFVTEYGLAPSTGGRRPQAYLLNKEKGRYLIGVAMDQLETRLTIYNLNGEVFYPVQHLRLKPFEEERGLSRLISFIKEQILRSGLEESSILGIGVGMPGFVNSESGTNQSFFDTGNTTLRDYLALKLGVPVFIDNDSSLIALAELRFGAGIGVKELMVVNIGWGTGLGMVIDGKLFKGYNGYAGEFSHIPLSNSNNLCSCGKRGCLEVDTSLLTMVEKARGALAAGSESSLKRMFDDQKKLAGDQFLKAAGQGDPLALSVLSEAAFQLGKGISTLIHIMNPQRIVLSGRGAVAGKMFLPSIQQAINEFCIRRIAEQTEVVVSELCNDAELLGAASLVVDHCDFC